MGQDTLYQWHVVNTASASESQEQVVACYVALADAYTRDTRLFFWDLVCRCVISPVRARVVV